MIGELSVKTTPYFAICVPEVAQFPSRRNSEQPTTSRFLTTLRQEQCQYALIAQANTRDSRGSGVQLGPNMRLR
jgi:hypothetical protein